MGIPVLVVRQAWLGGWTGPTRFTLRGGRFLPAAPDHPRDPAADLALDGTVFPGFRDAHVHLELIDAAALLAGGLDEVYDLGASLDSVAAWRQATADDPPRGLPRIRVAGQFLTAPGGYPSDRSWAPDGSVREVTGPDDAALAVTEQVCAGADLVKVMLHAAGPVPDDGTLAAIVSAAHRLSRDVVAHAEGAGQAGRALDAGVDVLAHTPWTERLDEDLVRAAARSQRWISTLAIHRGDDRERAVDNLRRFHAAGGRVHYGTDLGNGPLPLGINASEIVALFEAGLDRESVLATLVEGDAAARFTAGPNRVCWVPGVPPRDHVDFAHWLTGARVATTTDFEEYL